MFTAVLASLGRPAILHDTVVSLARQSQAPDEILVSVVEVGRDTLPETLRIPRVRVLTGRRGLTCQRNIALENLHPDCDLITFFDDDVALHRDYVRNCCEFMASYPEVVGMCGHVLADGILSGEISRADAVRILDEAAGMIPQPGYRRRISLPGNFMTYRRSAADRLRFDERLKLYALYEDYDFSARVARLGVLAETDHCLLVHLGTRTSRMSEVRFGYAQVMNPLYFWRKGSQTWRDAMLACVRPLISNGACMLVPRRGMTVARRWSRFVGNARGLRDYFVYGAQPERIEQI